MKVEPECLSCIIQRAYLEIAESTDDPRLQFKAASALLEFLARDFSPNANPAFLGTFRDRIIKHITRNKDIYSERKKMSNQAALRLLPFLNKMIKKQTSPEKRFRKACLASIVGNTIEFDIPKHEVNLDKLESLITDSEMDLAIDDIQVIYNEAKNAKNILFLADNAGEIVLDKLLIHELKRLGAEVTVAVKDAPILNDATLQDAKEASVYDLADHIITTGTDAVGLPSPKERSAEFDQAYNLADLVFAKGMGYAETIPIRSVKQPHVLLLRTKCNPVATHFEVPRNKNVAKLVGGSHENQ